MKKKVTWVNYLTAWLLNKWFTELQVSIDHHLHILTTKQLMYIWLRWKYMYVVPLKQNELLQLGCCCQIRSAVREVPAFRIGMIISLKVFLLHSPRSNHQCCHHINWSKKKKTPAHDVNNKITGQKRREVIVKMRKYYLNKDRLGWSHFRRRLIPFAANLCM